MTIDWGDIIKQGITSATAMAIVAIPLIFQQRRLGKQMDGINSTLRTESAAKDGEINRLQSPNSGLTPQTREDGGGSAPVTIDRVTNAVSVTQPPNKKGANG